MAKLKMFLFALFVFNFNRLMLRHHLTKEKPNSIKNNSFYKK